MSLIRKIKMLSPARQRKLASEQAKQRATVDKAIDIIKHTNNDKRGLFIDCGFNTRDVFDRYFDALHPDFNFIGFEIQPDLYKQAVNNQSRYDSSTTMFIHAAVSASNGELHYYEPKKWGLNYKGGSTIISAKNDRPSKKIPTKIKALNFSEFLEQHAQDHFVVIKMDIEGAEYDVMQRYLQIKMRIL